MDDRFSTLRMFQPGCLFRDTDFPQYLRLVNVIKELLASGHLAPGKLLPSTRELARHLNVSRKTVLRAYQELLILGTLESAKGVGTFVSENSNSNAEQLNQESRFQEPPFSSHARLFLASESKRLRQEHLWRSGACPLELLPVKRWRQCNLEVLRQLNLGQKDYELGSKRATSLRLKKTLSEFLIRRKGITCTPEQIKIFNSTITPIGLLTKLFLDAGESVALENPRYPYASDIFKAHGCRIINLPVDEHGLSVERLQQIVPHPKLVYVTPYHDLLGVKLAQRRRETLLEYCRSKAILIVEDDFGYEFAGNHLALQSLFRLDAYGLVIHISTFGKTLYPLSSASFIILPQGMEQAFERANMQLENWVGESLTCLEEVTISRFISQGYMEKHLQNTISVLRQRNKALRQAIESFLAPVAIVQPESASMHFCVHFNSTISPEVINRCAEEVDFPLSSIAPYYDESAPAHQFLFFYAFVDAASARELVQKFASRLSQRGAFS